jgi:phosphatidylserine synthase
LACTVVAIYSSILGFYPLVMIGMIWAVAFDWADGLIARKMKGRSKSNQTFGGQLDVLIDIVSYGVAPAILLSSYGEYKFIFLVTAFIILTASALRLSYFSTFGLIGGTKYTGLALDNNNIILVFIFLFESFFNHEIFSYIMLFSCLVIAWLNVSQIKTPKLSSNPRNVYTLGIYTIVLTLIYGWVYFLNT